MYKIIFKFAITPKDDIHTFIQDSYDLEWCKKELEAIKEHHTKLGSVIYELKIYQMSVVHHPAEV